MQKKKPADENKIGRANWNLKNNQNSRGNQYDCKKKKGGKTKNENLIENKEFNKTRMI